MGVTSDGLGTERRPHWGAVALAIVVLVVLVVVIASATDQDDLLAAPTTTQPPLPSTSSDVTPTTSTSTTSTTLGFEFPNLSEVVPGVTGTLHVLVGGQDRQLFRIPSDPDPTVLLPDVRRLGYATSLGFDRSGRLLGFIEGGRARSGLDRLNVWSETSKFGFGDVGVASYRWHETQLRRLAAITVDATGQAVLRTITFDDDSLAAEVDTVIEVAEDETMVGWGEYGFLIGQYDPRDESDVTTLLDQEGNVVWQRHEIMVLDASPDEILAQFGNGKHYVVEGADLDGLRLFLTLPDGATLTGSDFSSGGRLAVVYPLEARDSNLRVYDTGFETFTEFLLEGWRVWDLEWSADERFLLMPGTDDRGGHVVIFYDTFAEETSLLYFSTWVQWAVLE